MRSTSFVGVLHFLDALRALLGRELGETPILQQPVMQPVLVDRGQFEKQRFIQAFDDFFALFHGMSYRVCDNAIT